MRPRYSFSSRHNRKVESIRKQKSKYPDLVLKVLNESNIILEVLDSRFIEDTRNCELEKAIEKQNKKLIYVLNKSDLVKKPKANLYPQIFVSCKKRTGIKKLRDKIKEFSKQIKLPEGKEKIIVGVLGYPNTGKSSLINLLVGKKSAGTGADAGFTKGLQKLRLTSEIVLIDSPGVIPSKEYSGDDQKKISTHAKVGARSYSQAKDPELIVHNLMKEHGKFIQEYFGISTRSSEYLIEKLGRKKNFLKKGGIVDMDKTSRFILREWQEGKIKINN